MARLLAYVRNGLSSAWLVFAAGIAGCGQRSEQLPAVQPAADVQDPVVTRPWFRDATTESGLDFTYTNGEEANRYTLLESLGGGVGLIDYDRDGWLDVILPGGGGFDAEGPVIHGRTTQLFRNRGDGTFADVTAATGLDVVAFYSHGCAVADYDRDGWPDFAVTGYGRLALFHNEEGADDGRVFVEVASKAGIDDLHWSTSAAWADLDGNGYADLFVCHYADWSFANHPECKRPDGSPGRDVCPPQRFQPQGAALYLNQGDGAFRDATGEQDVRTDGCGLGVLIADLDGNGQPDVYVGNDATSNHLYLNRDGRLEEVGAAAGVAGDEDGQYDGSMGVDAGDYGGTGRPAIWVTNFQDELHALYAQRQAGIFYHASRAAGIAALGRRYVGFGTGFLDADNDGWEDLVIVNGHVVRHPAGATFRQRAVLLHNVERERRRFFEEATEAGGDYFQRDLLGRGLAIGDLNNDGWPDLIISHSNSPAAVLMNERGKVADHHWLGVELAGRDGRDVAGATVSLELDGRKLTRLVKGGGSYLSSRDRRVLFGLGKSEQINGLVVHWPWGDVEKWDRPVCDAYHLLREGEKEALRQTSSRPPPK
jgi:hypothetical protein